MLTEVAGMSRLTKHYHILQVQKFSLELRFMLGLLAKQLQGSVQVYPLLIPHYPVKDPLLAFWKYRLIARLYGPVVMVARHPSWAPFGAFGAC